MTEEFICWRCSVPLTDLILPMSRREECSACQADQHVCKMCEFFINGRCEEERAEHVSDTDRANFCDYFKPSSQQNNHNTDKSAAAKAQLAALFGDELTEDNKNAENLTPSELAEKKLRQMLNNGS